MTCGSSSSGRFSFTRTFLMVCGNTFRPATSCASGRRLAATIASTRMAVSRPSPVVASRERMMCPDCSPPENRAGLSHFLQHVFIAHGRAQHPDSRFAQRDLQPHVRHRGGNNGVIGQFAAALEFARQQKHDGVAIHHLAVAVGKERAVGIAIKADAQVGICAHTTSRATISGCSAPQFSLMLRPSGVRCVNSACAPERLNISGATVVAAPLAQSTTMRRRSAPGIARASQLR